MKRTLAVVAGLLIAAWSMPVMAQGGGGAGGAGGAAGGRGGMQRASGETQFDTMVTVLALEGETKTKVEAAIADGKAKVKAWDTANQEAMAALRPARSNRGGAAAGGAATTDTATTEANRQKLQELQAQRNAIIAEMKKNVLALLSADQLAKWQTSVVATAVIRRYSRLELTDAQKAKITELCAAIAKEVAAIDDMAATTDQTELQKRREARNALLEKVYAQVEADVLTAAQQDQYKKQASETGAAGGAAGGRGGNAAGGRGGRGGNAGGADGGN